MHANFLHLYLLILICVCLGFFCRSALFRGCISLIFCEQVLHLPSSIEFFFPGRDNNVNFEVS